MSWQSYIEDTLVGSGKISRAVILGQQGGIWASSGGHLLSKEEEHAVIDAYKNLEHTMSSGLKLAGEKFFCLSANPRSIYLKSQTGGAIVVKTTQAIIVAEYVAPVQSGEAAPLVEGLADYLIAMRY
ncbi:profilin-2 [Aspergillus transmontanensis]|uniref:Profilin n=1 Tax=Aspergillus transmontanensis TaxID=1034304 RepID=A0A5N6W1Q8_9EURO|nr:profilin-2 [Aspergillus transmontanensis]